MLLYSTPGGVWRVWGCTSSTWYTPYSSAENKCSDELPLMWVWHIFPWLHITTFRPIQLRNLCVCYTKSSNPMTGIFDKSLSLMDTCYSMGTACLYEYWALCQWLAVNVKQSPTFVYLQNQGSFLNSHDTFKLRGRQVTCMQKICTIWHVNLWGFLLLLCFYFEACKILWEMECSNTATLEF
jgi:hypothetical protein